MRILFDQGTPAPLAAFFESGEVTTARAAGLDSVPDGELLPAAEAKFDVLVTTDKNIKDQQNLTERCLAIIVLGNSEWAITQRYVRRIVRSVRAAKPGSYDEIDMPKY